MHLVGRGTFGQVVEAKHRASGKIVAIKLIEKIFEDEYESMKVIREVQLLRHFTQMKSNKYTTRVFDVV